MLILGLDLCLPCVGVGFRARSSVPVQIREIVGLDSTIDYGLVQIANS